MKIIKGSSQHPKGQPWPVVTIGNFDGVHRGHQAVFKQVIQMARQNKGTSVVLTFEPHPVQVLAANQDFRLLNPHHKKVEFIAGSGIDYLVSEPFTKELASLSAQDFVRTILVKFLEAKSIWIGSGFRFGRNRSGTVDILKKMGKQIGFEVHLIDPVKGTGEVVSSSRIRKLIREGNVEEAGDLLGRTYVIQGTVVEGHRKGNALGFPTANLDPGMHEIPAGGVYAARIFLFGKTYDGVVNIGCNPTFNRGRLSVEAHLFDFNNQSYGEQMEIAFVRRIRNEITFPSPEELVLQIRQDVQEARTILAELTT